MPTLSKIIFVTISFISLLGLCGQATAIDEGDRAPPKTIELRVAVASNFLPTLRDLAALYQAETGIEIKLISASTGKLYAQIIHGAPFDIFLSADSRRPVLLSDSGHAMASSRFIYALGKIALWSPRNMGSCHDELMDGSFRRMAIANPKTAPYGVAAQQVLEQLGLWQKLQSKLVRGENVAQTLHYVDSGNAELGIVTLSLVRRLQERTGCLWEIPQTLYQPIEQQAVLLKGSHNIVAAKHFLTFLKSHRATTLIRSHGYGVE